MARSSLAYARMRLREAGGSDATPLGRRDRRRRPGRARDGDPGPARRARRHRPRPRRPADRQGLRRGADAGRRGAAARDRRRAARRPLPRHPLRRRRRSSPRGSSPHSGGLGVRRTELHAALVRAGRGGGGRAALGRQGGGASRTAASQTDQGTFAARWIVGADGLRSPVRRWAGLDGRPRPRSRRFGVRRHFAMAPWSDFVEVYWGPECEAYVTPVAADEVGVALLWSGRKAGFDDLLASFPALRRPARRGARTPRATAGSGPCASAPGRSSRGTSRWSATPRATSTPSPARGWRWRFHESAALVAALVAGDLARYAAAHRRINRLPNLMTGLVLAMERRPALRARAIRGARRRAGPVLAAAGDSRPHAAAAAAGARAPCGSPGGWWPRREHAAPRLKPAPARSGLRGPADLDSPRTSRATGDGAMPRRSLGTTSRKLGGDSAQACGGGAASWQSSLKLGRRPASSLQAASPGRWRER